MSPDNTGEQQGGRFGKGRSGNPRGRPLGSRNSATLAAEALLEGEAEKLTRKCIELAMDGDTVALKLCLERIYPARRDRPVTFPLPPITSARDAADIAAAVAQAGPHHANRSGGNRQGNRNLHQGLSSGRTG